MKKLVTNAILALILLSLAACEEKTNSATLEVSPTTLHFESKGGTQVFHITSDTQWSISTPEPNIWISPTSGYGDKDVQVGVAATTNPAAVTVMLMVQTDDGSVTRNVQVEQDGVLESGEILTVTNNTHITFEGAAHSTDSLTIISNVPYEMTGPEWVEVNTKGGFAALSRTVPVTGSGSVDLKIRAASRNDSETDRQDVITLCKNLTGELKIDIPVTQLGRHRVQPNMMVPLANALATDWKCGSDVTQFHVKLYEGQPDVSSITTEDVAKWTIGKPGSLTSWSNLKENTAYYITTVGLDEAGGYYSVNSLGTMTRSGQQQALAAISNVANDGTKWTWATTMNEYCTAYFVWCSTNKNYFSSSDAAMAWRFNALLHGANAEKYPVVQKNTTWSSKGTSDIQIITWGVSGSSTTSGLIGRYKTAEAASRQQQRQHDISCEMSPIDMETFRQSFIRIK